MNRSKNYFANRIRNVKITTPEITQIYCFLRWLNKFRLLWKLFPRGVNLVFIDPLTEKLWGENYGIDIGEASSGRNLVNVTPIKFPKIFCGYL